MGIDLNRFKGKRNQEWLEWLEDDPVPSGLREKMRRQAVQDASRPAARTSPSPAQYQKQTPNPPAPGTKTVAIHISMPDPQRLKKQFIAFASRVKLPPHVIAASRNRREQIAGAAGVIVVVASLGTYSLLNNDSRTTDPSQPGVLSQNTQKPDFDYSLPKGKDSEVEGAVRFDAERKVVNYKDSIGGVPIIISQQQLPQGFKDDTDDKVKKLAEDFAATDVLSTANPTAYLGTSTEGPQTVIFAKKGLLVFIKSDKKIDRTDWAEYITNLE